MDLHQELNLTNLIHQELPVSILGWIEYYLSLLFLKKLPLFLAKAHEKELCESTNMKTSVGLGAKRVLIIKVLKISTRNGIISKRKFKMHIFTSYSRYIPLYNYFSSIFFILASTHSISFYYFIPLGFIDLFQKKEPLLKIIL